MCDSSLIFGKLCFSFSINELKLLLLLLLLSMKFFTYSLKLISFGLILLFFVKFNNNTFFNLLLKLFSYPNFKIEINF